MIRRLTLLSVLCLALVGCNKQTVKAPVPELTGKTVLLFNGTGTTSTDVAAVKTVLNMLGQAFTTVNSAEMNSMPEATLAGYTLLIVPGGNSITIGNNLSKQTTQKIRQAVQGNGLHYLGICAGAFLAGGGDEYNNINLANGRWFTMYSSPKHIASENLILAAAFQGSNRLDVYWQDGPYLQGWGDVVAKYPNGQPAIVEGQSGMGWMVLTGIHAEAPAGWRTCCTFTTSLATDLAWAAQEIVAARDRAPLPHF